MVKFLAIKFPTIPLASQRTTLPVILVTLMLWLQVLITSFVISLQDGSIRSVLLDLQKVDLDHPARETFSPVTKGKRFALCFSTPKQIKTI